MMENFVLLVFLFYFHSFFHFHIFILFFLIYRSVDLRLFVYQSIIAIKLFISYIFIFNTKI